MKINDSHTSSRSNKKSISGVRYKSEGDVKTFTTDTNISSGSLHDPYITIKSAHSRFIKDSHSPSFRINVVKIAREEANLRFNKKISGKKVFTASTENE